MPYHIDEENSELAFEVREGNKLVIKIKSNIFSDSLELYLIKVGDNTEPTDKNVFSSLRVLKEIENLHDTILKEINSVTSGFWELKQDSQGNEYISTKYNVLTEGGITAYGLGEQKLGTIYDGLPIDNDTIYWEEVEGSRVLKAKGSGGGSTGLDETKLWSVLGSAGNQQINPSHLTDAFNKFNNDFVTTNTEQTITAIKHFSEGLSVGSSKKKIYEENGVVYIDADVAVTGAMTFYASAGRSVSTIMDGVTVDEETITKGSDNVLRIKNAGAGGSFDKSAMWNALAGSTTEQINKTHLTTALDNYPTKTGSGASGTWGIGITGNAGSATKLQTARTLWGRSFDGTGNVSGEISTCTRIRNSDESPLYLGNSNNASWVYTQDIASHNGVENWAIGITGTAWFKNVNIGYAHPATGNYLLNVDGVISCSAYTGNYIRIECDDNGSNLQLKSAEINNFRAPLYLQHSSSFNLICCKGGGKVGIGTDAPNGKLHVEGNIYTSAIVSAYGYTGNHIRMECDNHGENIASRIDEINNYSATLYLQHDTSNNLICCNGGGKVGIGTTSPTHKLTVEGNTKFLNVETHYGIGTDETGISSSAYYDISIPTIPAYKHRYVLGWQDNTTEGYTTGYGIGVYRSATKWGSMILEVLNYENKTRRAQLEIRGHDNVLWFSGDILAEGGGTFYGSDIRYKSIIHPVMLLALNKIAEAPSFVYRWNRPNMNQNRLNLGGSAQYTQSVLPWAVEENDNFLSMDYATVAYTFAVHTARHLLTYESRTDKKIKKLENRVKYLEKQLKKLGYEEVRTLDDQSV